MGVSVRTAGFLIKARVNKRELGPQSERLDCELGGMADRPLHSVRFCGSTNPGVPFQPWYSHFKMDIT